MERWIVLSSLCLIGSWVCVSCNPGRPDVPYDQMALQIFHTAESNRTPDGCLTLEEMKDIFTKFDKNDDCNVDRIEFVAHWTTLKLGNLEHAVTFFQRTDTDGDGSISCTPEFERIFYYFDRDVGETTIIIHGIGELASGKSPTCEVNEKLQSSDLRSRICVSVV